jgi:2-iminobutanoate/2-iminopropanoate deaminase
MGESVKTSSAPEALGPYSQAVKSGNYLFCSGQLGLDPATGDLLQGIGPQTQQAMANLSAVLTAGGTSFDKVVKTTIFLVNMGDFAAVNEIYGTYFESAPPARSTVQVAALPKGGLVEIEMIAEL